jgi:L-arabinose isomerase
MEQDKCKIALVGTTMGSFDAVADVVDVRDMSQYQRLIAEVAGRLRAFGEVVELGIVGDGPEALACHRRIEQEDCDVLVIWPINYTLDVVVLQLTAGLKTPVILWNTMAQPAISPDADFGRLMENNAIACLPTITNVLLKNDIPFKLLSGAMDDRRVLETIGRRAAGSHAARRLRGARIGKIGDSYPGISAISVDEATLVGQFGVNVVPLPLPSLVKAYKNVPDEEVQRLATQVVERCTVKEITAEEIAASVRFEPALRELVKRHRLDGLASLCPLLVMEPEIGVTPCHAHTVLTEEGCPVTCECDLATVVAMLLLQQLAGDVLFLEFYAQDFAAGQAMLAHCGQGNRHCARPSEPVTLTPHPAYVGSRGRGISYEFVTREGEATYACLTYLHGRWRMVAGLMEATRQPQRPCTTIQMYFRFPGGDFDRVFHRFCELGGIHHLAVGYGNHLEGLRAACESLGVEFVSPDP